MLRFTDTKEAGHRAEKEVRDVLQQYTRHVYSNVRVDTLFTKSGTTEIDVLAAVEDVILVVEVKNLAKIEGRIADNFWYLTGMETGERYSALNILTQNRIHVRSFKDAWLANRGEIPVVMSVVVVPNGCRFPDDIADGGVISIQQFRTQLAELSKTKCKPRYGYALDFVVQKDNAYIERSDFSGGSNGKV